MSTKKISMVTQKRIEMLRRIFSKIAGIVAYVCLQAVVNSISTYSPKQVQVTGMHSVAAPQDINAFPTGLAGSGHNPLPLSLGRKNQH